MKKSFETHDWDIKSPACQITGVQKFNYEYKYSCKQCGYEFYSNFDATSHKYKIMMSCNEGLVKQILT